MDASLADELDRMQRAPQNSCDRVLRMHNSLVNWRRQLHKRGGHDVEVSHVFFVLVAHSGWGCACPHMAPEAVIQRLLCVVMLQLGLID